MDENNETTGPKSGDLCRLLPGGQAEHYRCDEHADGEVTRVYDGAIMRPAKPGALIGFER